MNVWTSAVNVAVRLAEETADDTVFDPNKVSPGVEGFLMTGLLAVAVIGLGFVLVRRMRANNYRHEVREQIEAELAEAADAAETEAAPDRGDAGEPGAAGALGADDSAQK
ncbi:hypothetical protein [Leucobacter salsicius]|uniref:hypothetical protein n=1 Tax=Leucobacter salsicius TaxID=664638 RepID=UPI00034B3177|nr:hypothetical protein [Leucobacter salsicius]